MTLRKNLNRYSEYEESNRNTYQLKSVANAPTRRHYSLYSLCNVTRHHTLYRKTILLLIEEILNRDSDSRGNV